LKYELENHTKTSLPGHFFGAFRTSPNMNAAAKSGSPQMTGLRPTIPASVPPVAAGSQGVSSEVSVSTVADSFRYRQESRRAHHTAWAGRRRGRYRHHGLAPPRRQPFPRRRPRSNPR